MTSEEQPRSENDHGCSFSMHSYDVSLSQLLFWSFRKSIFHGIRAAVIIAVFSRSIASQELTASTGLKRYWSFLSAG